MSEIVTMLAKHASGAIGGMTHDTCSTSIFGVDSSLVDPLRHKMCSYPSIDSKPNNLRDVSNSSLRRSGAFGNIIEMIASTTP